MRKLIFAWSGTAKSWKAIAKMRKEAEEKLRLAKMAKWFGK